MDSLQKHFSDIAYRIINRYRGRFGKEAQHSSHQSDWSTLEDEITHALLNAEFEGRNFNLHFIKWLVALDDQGNTDRKSITLNQIIAKARDLLPTRDTQ